MTRWRVHLTGRTADGKPVSYDLSVEAESYQEAARKAEASFKRVRPQASARDIHAVAE